MSNELQSTEAKLPALALAQGQGAGAPPPPPALGRELRRPALVGFAVVVAFFVIGGGWAATAPLSAAAIASGVVSPEGSIRTVQHLEGGIIREILVREGDVVQKGDVLMVLDDVQAQAEVGALSNRLEMLAAREARLDAERNGEAEIRFDHPALADRNDPGVQEIIAQQRNQFETRKATDEGREAILAQRIAQNEQQIIGFERQITGTRRQMELIREELGAKKILVAKGYAPKPQLLALQREEAELLGTEGELLARIARTEETIGETKLQIINIKMTRVEEADTELTDVQSRRAEVEQQIKQSLDKLSRTTITAPVPGTVLNLKFKTLGGVVRPGEPVFDIVPSEVELIIDARLSPKDIDDVHVGMHGYVMFPTYPQRFMKRIEAELIHVSADSMQDERTGMPYYTARIRVDADQLKEVAPEVVLQPGLPAEAYLSVREQTLLEYLMQPVFQTFEHTFRES